MYKYYTMRENRRNENDWNVHLIKYLDSNAIFRLECSLIFRENGWACYRYQNLLHKELMKKIQLH
jgi:hypothetical protein